MNFAATPPSLIAAQLFGHEEGACTGANQLGAGRSEVADHGTLFLDEIGDMPIEARCALLRVLQKRQLERLGGSRTIPVDVHVIAATRYDLSTAIESGKIRLGMRAARDRGIASGEPFEHDSRLRGKDGIYRWFLPRHNPLAEEGRARRWDLTATAIESRKQEEERVRKENVRLEERTRIAQELHDTLLQTFQSASLHLGAALYRIAQDSPVKSQLDRILRIMRQGIAEGRDAIQGCVRLALKSQTWLLLCLAFRKNSRYRPISTFAS